MKKWSDLEKRVDRLERGLGRSQEPDYSERFWATMVGREEELYRRITNLWPFEEVLDALWRACQTREQGAVDKAWESLSFTQRTLWDAHTALHEHIERRLEEPNLPEFDPSTWPEEVRKLVLEEVEE